MEELQIHVPAMYGDHHVLEVRHILLELPGVVDVNASSCFQTAQVRFDPALTGKEAISAVLEAAGYMQPMQIPSESGVPAYGNDGERTYFRITSAHVQTKNVVQFSQQVPYSLKALWPCPGMGVISRDEDGENG